jgi:hypothetical protein
LTSSLEEEVINKNPISESEELLTSPTNPQYLASIRIEDYCLKGATTHHRLAEAKLEPVRCACDGYAALLALCFNSSRHI